MKGIILAGGKGTRLYPITKGISKQLMPIFNKPMIYYPLATLMQANIRDILIITTPDDQQQFKNLLKDGSQWGVHLTFAIQPEPKGIAQAFTIGADFIGNDPIVLVLGDTIFYGNGFTAPLADLGNIKGGMVFAYKVEDPERYGVVEFDEEGCVTSIIEKPDKPASNFAVVGLYAYDNRVIEIARNAYLELGELEVIRVDNQNGCFDTGTFDSMTEAVSDIMAKEKRTGTYIGSPDTVAMDMGWISESEDVSKQFVQWIEPQIKSGYGEPWREFVEKYHAKRQVRLHKLVHRGRAD